MISGWRRRGAPPHLLGALGLAACSPQAAVGQPAPLVLEQTIALPGVTGRIDHLALDLKRQKLFVAGLGAGVVEAVDLAAGRVVGRVRGLAEPQGLAVLPDPGLLAVATGGDGALRFYREDDLSPAGELRLGDDADNVHAVPGANQVVVGYGSGALATVDAQTRRVTASTPLPAHPEGFQLVNATAYVNLPDAGAIGVADLSVGRVIATWPTRGRRWNFPLAIDPTSGDVAVVYRLPARLALLDPKTGGERAAAETCGDSDDLFFDEARARIYVACGDGHVDVFTRQPDGLRRIAHIATSAGARTALFSPKRDRLYVAARATGGKPAAILVLRPQ
jgi:hypothetical protein